MIYGIGTDIVNISRIKKMDSLKSFSEKILSANELKMSASYDINKFISYLENNLLARKLYQKPLEQG